MRFKLVDKDDPNFIYESDQRNFVLGRSKECEIIINDPHISRVQARVCNEDNGFYIENLGQNPMLINDQTSSGQFLNNGDVITLGKTSLRFTLDSPYDETADQITFDEKTVVMAALPKEVFGLPRLVLTTETGDTETYPIDKAPYLIGRSEDADISLQDPSVSRRHGMIEKQAKIYTIKNLSQTNPILLNDKAVDETRLFSGDHIRIGSFSLTFISDWPEDAKPMEEKVITEKKGPGWGLWLVGACLLVVVGGFLFYRHAYSPWQINRNLDLVATQISAGKYEAAQENLKPLLAIDLSLEGDRKVHELLAQIALGIVRRLAEAGRLEEAEGYLVGHLDQYGVGEESAPLQEQLDRFRLEIARNLEANSQNQAALSQYALIRQDSALYEHARQGIRRIWLESQQELRQNQNLVQLLQEADLHFSEKRYLTPVNNNAYSIYQNILTMEPNHAEALERIEEIKAFYRLTGERYFSENNYKRALTYFEGYNFISPETPDIQQKIDICRVKLSAPKTANNRDQVEKVLDESGIESSRIIKFLYEDQNGKKDAEKPW